ncbi:hypothetical protein H6P81_011185 [Aristolochia fimbriata]|uniref:Conserved oligomeric Golgi complex subunit 2 n=1 Tax=Aristolochia fimbriata TaxID=158543 RepID=A0AAV7EQT3_ARIFI|nr:hypothetical protein H6P81_011185 [Aristolochia fimbriata]
MTDLLPPRPATDLFGDPIDVQPLWFKKSAFLEPNFDPESYISDLRSFVPFDNLRAELRSHFASLKNELVELINREYGDFVNLSTKLVDVDGAVVRMRAPLLELREKIAQFRGSLDGSLAALKNGLKLRSEASKARETLELLLDTFHVVSKVEKLMSELPDVPTDWSTADASSVEKSSLSNGLSSQLAENGMNVWETQSMVLERIASEMNRLKFYIAHGQDLPFIKNMDARIRSASLVLDGSLGHCFIAGLEHRDASAIYNCLRAYAAIDNTSGAEEIFRSTVVSPMVQQIIVPSSFSQVVAGSTIDELAPDYELIKQFIEKDCKFLLEISSSSNSGLHVFDFLANSILKEVLMSIQKGKPGALSPGKPGLFLKNYKSSLEFLSYLEGFCPSRSAVAKFRTESVYSDFMKLWNVGVYFSLRFQEIAGSLDSALTETTIIQVKNSTSDSKAYSRGLTLKQSIALLESLYSCWKEDVLLFSCSDKFLRLSLQLISRYSTWMSSGFSARKAGSAGSNPVSDWAVAANPEDFVYVMHDIGHLVSELNGNYLDRVLELLAPCGTEVLDLVKQSISQGGKLLQDMEPHIMEMMTEALVEKSVEDLRQLKGITATYRMTNKPLPVRHSPYVSGVLRPLKAFLDGEHASYLTTKARNELLRGAAERITGRYNEMASDLVNVARKTESSLLRIRQGAQRRAGANADQVDQNISDTDKICLQLFLDVQEYGRNLSAIGIAAEEIPAYRSLWQCVAPSKTQT